MTRCSRNGYSVKNFERFQHYKDRSPPWIKLYNELLDDYEFGLGGRLTPKQTQVCELVALGWSNKAIATKLGIEPRTVERHRANVYDKNGRSQRG
jgi:DNA-binding NarL/FixJ family response regulator